MSLIKTLDVSFKWGRRTAEKLAPHWKVGAREKEVQMALMGHSFFSHMRTPFWMPLWDVLFTVSIMKMKRRQTAQQLARAKCLINKANSMKDPFEMLQMYHTYKGPNDYSVNLSCVKATEASSECRLWVFDIMERNMKNLYEQCSWGWDAPAKQKELTEPTAWYLIASYNNKFIGFSHFRFDIDYKIQVLYCYEVQLEESARGKGLGRFMMQALESMALQHKMQKVVLTVLKNNPSALRFFQAIGYKLDNTNPLESEKKDYVILSKQVLIPAS